MFVFQTKKVGVLPANLKFYQILIISDSFLIHFFFFFLSSGEVVNKVADIAVVDLTITLKRAEAVDFTLPFMNTGISILFKKPTTKVTTLFSFLSPFTGLVWIYVLTAYIGVSTILFFVGRMSPYEWENPNPCQQEENVLENNFSLVNSFFFTIGSMMQQGSELAPK